MAAAVGLALTAPAGPVVVLPWLIILGLLFYSAFRVRRGRNLEARVQRVTDLAMLRRYVPSLRLAWQLLPAVSRNPELHLRTVVILGLNLDSVGACEAALVTYQYMLERLPKNHPGLAQLQAQAALAQLASDHLLDADATLRRLRDLENVEPANPVTATYHLARLAQMIRTHHDAEALPMAAGLVERLRPLGVEAGYGYGLMALAHHRVNLRRDETVADGTGETYNDESAAWWSKATLLLPVEALTHRYTELAALTADETVNTATRSPLPPA